MPTRTTGITVVLFETLTKKNQRTKPCDQNVQHLISCRRGLKTHLTKNRGCRAAMAFSANIKTDTCYPMIWLGPMAKLRWRYPWYPLFLFFVNKRSAIPSIEPLAYAMCPKVPVEVDKCHDLFSLASRGKTIFLDLTKLLPPAKLLPS